jgi:ribonuclease HII
MSREVDTQIRGYIADDPSKDIIGSDEVGFGSWAGPLVTCAVVVPKDWRGIAGLNDSKKLSPKKRESLFELLQSRVRYTIEMAHSDEIDRDGVISALHRCFRACIEKALEIKPGALVVIDGDVKLPGLHYIHFPKADGIVPAVMAASVIGKVIHDRYMWTLAERYPGYGLHKCSGYGTPDHHAAIKRLGLTPIHRKSYIPA